MSIGKTTADWAIIDHGVSLGEKNDWGDFLRKAMTKVGDGEGERKCGSKGVRGDDATDAIEGLGFSLPVTIDGKPRECVGPNKEKAM